MESKTEQSLITSALVANIQYWVEDRRKKFHRPHRGKPFCLKQNFRWTEGYYKTSNMLPQIIISLKNSKKQHNQNQQ